MHTDKTSARGSWRKVPEVSVVVLAGVFLGCASTASPGTPGIKPASVRDPTASFTVEQVARGRDEFRGSCGECHSTGEFRGRTFLFRWRRQTAWDFFRQIVTTMPEDAPGSLPDRAYADVIAFVLEMNGYAAGNAELPATEEALDVFVMDGGTSP